MAWSAVASTTIRIGNLLTDEAIYLWGVEEQVDRLQTELKWMQSFLIEADAKQAEDEVLRLWVSQIRDLAYDAEDVVEAYALKVGYKRKGGFANVIKRSARILKKGPTLHKTRAKIEKIIVRITELTRRLETYGIKRLRIGEGSSSSNERRRESRRPYPHIIDDNIVGLDADIKKMVSILVDNESDCRVVSICGTGGKGKTTLAKKVYQHSDVRDHFSHLAWVYVSEQCQKRKVWEDILSDFHIMEKDKKKKDEDLAEMLFNFLKNERCLVILDDIWSREAWESINPALPMRETKSKILLTSRNKEIVSDTDTRPYLHELEFLKEKESRELFRKIAFSRRDSTDYRDDGKKQELGENMVKHCAGLPLAIVVLAGTLAKKNYLNEWQIVYENVNAHLNRGKRQGIEEVLALSYDNLPSYLRPCFLYLSHFPEDYQIDAHTLIQYWIAEGIVPLKQEEGNGGEIIEDVAESCLIELGDRFMIQVRERDVATLKIKTIQMHDLMRNFCLTKAKQEKFLFVIDQSNAYSSSTIRRVRRVSAHKFFGIQRIESPNIRSLLLFEEFFPLEVIEYVFPRCTMLLFLNYLENHGDGDNKPLFWIALISFQCILWLKIGGFWKYIFDNFKLLRVLSFMGGDDGGFKLPSDISKLIHLRFLSLRDLQFVMTKLPSSLGNLRCLLTLDLRFDCDGLLSDSIHVPNVIWRMKQLRHLYLPERCKGKTKLKLETLTNLQTLVNFNTKICYVRDLFNMTNLRDLEILGQFNIEGFKEDLGQNSPIIGSNCLRSLSLNFGDRYLEGIDPRHLAHLLSSCVCICKLIIEVEIRKLPEYNHFSQDITYIYLSSTNLDEDPMPILEKLLNLKILKLSNSAFTVEVIICSAGGFHSLDSLSLDGLADLEEWKVEKGAMPALCSLKIENCGKLNQLPDGLKFITSLQELKIEHMPKTFKDKMVEGGEDFYRVQHVPSVIFRKCDELDW